MDTTTTTSQRSAMHRQRLTFFSCIFFTQRFILGYSKIWIFNDCVKNEKKSVIYNTKSK